jgi:hypothetical protein
VIREVEWMMPGNGGVDASRGKVEAKAYDEKSFAGHKF